MRRIDFTHLHAVGLAHAEQGPVVGRGVGPRVVDVGVRDEDAAVPAVFQLLLEVHLCWVFGTSSYVGGFAARVELGVKLPLGEFQLRLMRAYKGS